MEYSDRNFRGSLEERKITMDTYCLTLGLL